MKHRTLFIVKYFVFWVLLFIIARVAFLVYEHSQSFSLPAITWLQICLHGLKMDLSTAGYLTLIPSLVILLTSFFKYKPAYHIINTYTAIVLVAFILIILVDMEVYKYWGSRLDKAPLRFLDKPKEVLASSSLTTIIIYLLTFLVLIWLLFRLYKKFVASSLLHPEVPGLKGMPVFLLFTALLFIPIRGGFGVAPINTGCVYFCKTAFANHAAVNVVWNFGHSVVEGKESHNPYIFSRDGNYVQPLLELYESPVAGKPVISNKRPNILLLVLESFSAKLIEPLGGQEGITPRFNELARQGVLFSNIYSTDSRTDKGLATVLSGYPVLEAIPVMKYPDKTRNLPFLSKTLSEKGYHSSFLYGGDVDFANMRSYLINGGINKITSESDFPASLRTGKWGVRDHHVFNRFIEDIKSDTGKWFKIMLTLTNHEPFDIPGKPKFGDDNLSEKFFSSAYYADSCLGDFIDRFKKTGLWDSTLIIMVADHGSRLPGYDDIFSPRKHHIPMLWTGGAVSRDTVITKIGSQADLAHTLLCQMGLPVEGYVLGKDLLSPASRSFAFYSVKNGIAMITDSSSFCYDFTINDYSFILGNPDPSHTYLARFFQQYVFDNYLGLSRRR